MAFNLRTVTNGINVVDVGAKKLISLHTTSTLNTRNRCELRAWTNTHGRQHSIGINALAVIQCNAITIRRFVDVGCKRTKVESGAFCLQCALHRATSSLR